MPSIAGALPDGTYEPTLGYPDQVVQERVGTPGPSRRVTTAAGAALASEQLARSTAGALLLLLVGAHLRCRLGAAPPDR